MIINMRDSIVVLLRGVPGSGKSSWIKDQHLDDYTISLDKIRLMLSNPVKTQQGYYEINQAVSEKAWKLAYECLKSRMDNGGTTFFDATFMNAYLINYVKNLAADFGYTILIIDFTSVGLAEAKRRNQLRNGTIRYVPEHVLDDMWQEGATMTFEGISRIDYREVESVIGF